MDAVALEQRPRILVVDDVRANLVAMRRLLSQVDAEIVEADSGEAALAACLDQQFALILLDIQMPGMDGFEVAELLSGQGEMSNTPVIFVTANYTEEIDHLKGYKLGAVDYITKPVNETVLLAKVRAFLELYRTRNRLQLLLGEIEKYADRLQQEVQERKRAEARALYQASHDGLTELPNRAAFYEQLEQTLQRGTEASILVYIDLDGFKAVNDDHGHAAGDALLCAVAGRLRNAFRAEDMVARLGGDEFAVLLRDVSGDASALGLRLAQQAVDALAMPFRLETRDGLRLAVQIGGSAGVTLATAADRDADLLMARADKAMYEAKRAGKGKVVFASQPAGA